MSRYRVPDWVHEYLQLAAEVDQIAESTASAETKYRLIFSERVSRRLNELYVLRYNDPGMDYADDVKAYAWALREQADEIRKAYGVE